MYTNEKHAEKWTVHTLPFIMVSKHISRNKPNQEGENKENFNYLKNEIEEDT